jgi:hypothetical protein
MYIYKKCPHKFSSSMLLKTLFEMGGVADYRDLPMSVGTNPGFPGKA